MVAAGVFAAAALAAAQTPPNLAGTWVLDRDKTAARSAAPSGMRAGGPDGRAGAAAVGARGGPATPPEWRITQTAAALRAERALPNGTTQTLVYKLDGSESTNANGRATLTTRSRWEGGKLVTEGTQLIATEQGPVAGTLKEVRWLDKEGSMVVETTRAIDENPPSTITQVFVRKDAR
jgi:hypothetical protein